MTNRQTFDPEDREAIRRELGTALADVVLSDVVILLRLDAAEPVELEPGGPAHVLAAVTAGMHDLTGEIPGHALARCLRDLADRLER